VLWAELAKSDFGVIFMSMHHELQKFSGEGKNVCNLECICKFYAEYGMENI
jgi:hypothetical protein